MKRITYLVLDTSLVFFLKVIMFWQTTGSVPLGRNLQGKGGILMGKGVCWVDDLAKAKETAKKTNKPILLDFFNPQ